MLIDNLVPVSLETGVAVETPVTVTKIYCSCGFVRKIFLSFYEKHFAYLTNSPLYLPKK